MREDILEALDRFIFTDGLTGHTRTRSECCLKGQLCRLSWHNSILFLCIGSLEIIDYDHQ